MIRQGALGRSPSARGVALLNTRNDEEFVAKSRELGIEVSPEEAEINVSQRCQWHGEDIHST